MTESVLAAVRDTIEKARAETRAAFPELATSLLEAQFGPDLLPEMLPALGPAFVDDLGRIWVSRFRPAATDRWRQEDSWHVLDPTGRPLARVMLPKQSRLAAVKSDRIALIMRDDLEVEHIRVFAITSDG